MVNLEKVQLSKQKETLTELLGLLDNSEDEHLTIQSGCKRDTQDLHCHMLENTKKLQDKTQARRKLLITCVICLIFMIGEIIGGYVAHSLAIMTDAAHLLTDFASVLISLFSLWISSRPPSKNLTFGWHRSEVLGALLSVLSIWTVTVVLVLIAVQRIVSDDYEIHSDVMIFTAVCAVALNICLAVILHQSPVSHIGHSHGETEEHRNTSVRAAFIHVLGDLLQSLGVLVAAIIIYFRPEWKIADPVCTFLFSILVLGTTYTILKDLFNILMEGVPCGIDFDSVNEVLLSVDGVKSTHSLHMWALTANQSQLSVHAVIDAQTDPQAALMDMSKLLHTEYGFSNITIQIEAYSED